MFKFLLAFLFPAWIAGFCLRDHDFKMSVCELVQVPAKDGFEVKFYLFKDDLTHTLASGPNAALPSQETIGAYILQHFDLSVDGKLQTLHFQSMREKNDQVLVQFATDKLKSPRFTKVSVHNSLLIENFKDQSNMIYLILPEKSKMTQVLNAGKTQGDFSL